MEVEWSDMALAQLREVIEYVSERFGEQVALDTYCQCNPNEES